MFFSELYSLRDLQRYILGTVKTVIIFHIRHYYIHSRYISGDCLKNSPHQIFHFKFMKHVCARLIYFLRKKNSEGKRNRNIIASQVLHYFYENFIRFLFKHYANIKQSKVFSPSHKYLLSFQKSGLLNT